MHSDNGPLLMSVKFSNFAEMYEFDHTTSSPEYSQSDGKFENAVKTSKNLLKEAVQTDLDFQLTLFDGQTTQTDGSGMHSSPGHQMFCRRTRTLLPTSRELLQPTLITDVREKKLNRKGIQTRCYDRTAKELPSLAIHRLLIESKDGIRPS